MEKLDIKELPRVFHLAEPQQLMPQKVNNKLIDIEKYQTSLHTVIPIMKPISKLIDYQDYE